MQPHDNLQGGGQGFRRALTLMEVTSRSALRLIFLILFVLLVSEGTRTLVGSPMCLACVYLVLEYQFIHLSP